MWLQGARGHMYTLPLQSNERGEKEKNWKKQEERKGNGGIEKGWKKKIEPPLTPLSYQNNVLTGAPPHP